MPFNGAERMYLSAMAPQVLDLMDRIDAAWDANPQMAPAYKQLSENMEGVSRDTIAVVERNMGNPQFKSQLENLALNHPEALARAIPDLKSDPNAMVEKINALNQAVGPAAPTPQVAAPIGVMASAAVTPPLQSAPAVESVAPVSVAVPGQNPMGQLMGMLGAEEFMGHVAGNERLSAAFDTLAGGGNDGAQLQQFANRASQDPEFFNKLNTMIEQNPDAVASVADRIVADPDNAVQTLDSAMQMQDAGGGMMAGLQGMMGNLGLDGMDMQGMFSMVANLVMSLINMVTGAAGSSREMLGMDNGGGALLNNFANATGFSGVMSMVDPTNGTASTLEQTRDVAANAQQPGAPQNADQQRNLQANQPSQGMTPVM